MDKDRVIGSAKQIKGTVKQVVGKAVGDAKLEAEGNADKIEGQVQNAVGGLKDTLRRVVGFAVPVDVPAPIIILLVH